MTPNRSPPSKATLYCPECPHRSHVTGDWDLVETDGEVRLVCPDCGTTITTRPAPEVRPRTVVQ